VIDIGVNLTNQRFTHDLLGVLERAISTGIERLIVTGTSIAVSQQALALCQKHPDYLSATAGIHPHDADNVNDYFIAELTELANHPSVKAIGECGLDFNRNFSSPENQIKVFKAQIALAAQLEMPLFLHQRDAFEPWFDLLKPYFDRLPAMISHCFTGNKNELQCCLDAGMYIGITGWLCDHRRGKQLQDIVKYIPLDRLLIETDAPYLKPKTMITKTKNSRNEPCYLPYVVQKLAEKTAYSVPEIIAQTSVNARHVFRLDQTNKTLVAQSIIAAKQLKEGILPCR